MRKNIRLVLTVLIAYFVSSSYSFAFTIQTTKKAPVKPVVQSATQPPANTAAQPVAQQENADSSPKENEQKEVEKKAAAVPLVMEEPKLEEPKLDEPAIKPPSLEALKKGAKEESVGGVAGILQKRADEEARKRQQSQGQGAGGNALYWQKVMEEHRNKVAEELAKKNDADVEDEETESEPKELVPEKRPDVNYRTELLPSSINKKQYTKENSHLPPAVYEDEYKKIMFDSAAVGNVDVLRAMIKRLGTTEVRDAEGNTPLLYAVMAENLKSVMVLAGSNASLNVKNNAGVSPLYAAVKVSRYDIVKILVNKGADLNIADNSGKNLLMLAIENNDDKMAKMLVKKGVNVNEAMSDGETALHLAAKSNNAALAKLLVANGADTEVPSSQGLTPLMLAAENGADDTSDVLIKAGADAEKKNIDGQNAVKLASKKGFTSVAELIESGNIRKKMEKAKSASAEAENAEVILSEVPALKLTSKDQIPVPMLKPLQNKTGKVPTPFFTEEQKKQMN